MDMNQWIPWIKGAIVAFGVYFGVVLFLAVAVIVMVIRQFIAMDRDHDNLMKRIKKDL